MDNMNTETIRHYIEKQFPFFESGLKDRIEEVAINDSPANQNLIVAEAILVGTISGISGAGGGFLIIPFLTILNKVAIKTAIGTSLLIIGIQPMLGFLSELNAIKPDWALILEITLLSVSGFFVGNYLSHKFSGTLLKHTFGWFVLCIGIYIILKELAY